MEFASVALIFYGLIALAIYLLYRKKYTREKDDVTVYYPRTITAWMLGIASILGFTFLFFLQDVLPPEKQTPPLEFALVGAAFSLGIFFLSRVIPSVSISNDSILYKKGRAVTWWLQKTRDITAIYYREGTLFIAVDQARFTSLPGFYFSKKTMGALIKDLKKRNPSIKVDPTAEGLTILG